MAARTDSRDKHHQAPRCLVPLHEAPHAGGLDAEGLAAWVEWEAEALRWGVDPDVSREDFAALVASSTTNIPTPEHHRLHKDAGDFARWGRRGGLRTLALYGRPYFSLLARLRWGRVEVEVVVSYREAVR